MEKITDINQLDLNKVYSYADYLLWKFEERIELIKGRIFRLSPAPSRKYQDISGNIYRKFFTLFNRQPCKLYYAPFDVRFPKETTENETIYTVVQPDLCIICDENKLDDRGCIGAPDLIVEILSLEILKKNSKINLNFMKNLG